MLSILKSISTLNYICYAGEHHLNKELIIRDVENFTITRSKIDGIVALNIHCISPAGVAVVNSSHVILSNLEMKDFAINFTRLFERHPLQCISFFEHVGLFVLNSWFVLIKR